MDILIKNMELPKNYPYRLTIEADGTVMEHCFGYKAKAIELPEHGRLIDADFFKDYAIRVHTQEGKEYIPADYIDIVPTVLEATKTDNKKKYSSGYPYPSETATSYSKTMEAVE